MRRLLPFAHAFVYAAVPIFPAFISLTSVAYPGVSLVPAPIVFAVLGCVGLLAVYAAILLVRDRAGAPPQPLLLPMFAWFCASMLAALLGLDPAAGVLFVCIFGLSMVWHCALVAFWNDRNVAAAVLWAYTISGTVAAGAALVMVATRHPAALYAIGHGRAIGTFVLPGELAAYLVIFLPIAYALTQIAAGRALRATAWIALIVGSIALAATVSRAGWMGCAAAVAFLIAARARGRRFGAIKASVVLIVGVAIVALFFNAQHNPSEDYTRLAIWQSATQVIDRFPLTGVGPFDFSRIYPLVRVPDGEVAAFHAHSLYLTFFAELGILGLAAFLWNVWTLAATLRARLPAATPEGALLALAAAAGLVGVAVQGLIDTMSIVIFGLWMPTMGLVVAATTWRPRETP
jgi:O-antigen ligase